METISKQVETVNRDFGTQAFAAKTLSAHTTKSAQTSSNPALAGWVQDNRHLYEAIVSGTADLSQANQAQFMDWWNFAVTELQAAGSSWNNGLESSPGNGAAAIVVPEGAKLGAQNNIVFASEKAETCYQPSALPIDVLSDEFTLNIAEKLRGKVMVKKTVDTRLQPAVEVIKITVNDPDSKPSATVYYVNPEAVITINSVGGKGVEQHGTTVTVGKYEASSESTNASAEASVAGSKNEKGEIEYEQSMAAVLNGEFVDFTPQGSGKNGENQIHVVMGNANIVLESSDHVHAVKGADGVLTVTVTHKDGSLDTFKIGKGFKSTLLAHPDFISLGDGKEGDISKGIPGLTINGEPEKIVEINQPLKPEIGFYPLAPRPYVATPHYGRERHRGPVHRA